MGDLRQQLEENLRGRVCFLGLGNANYGDDGTGVRLAEELIQAGVPDVVIAGNTPEAFIGRIAGEGFDHLVFLDAVDFGGEPGSVVFLNADEIAARFAQISTHKISLGLLARQVEANGTTRTWLLGVQPASLRSGTLAVSTTVEILAELLGNLWSTART
jgi:hydrogenase 3 maturation protease